MEALGSTKDDAYILPTAKYVLGPLAEAHSKEAASRLKGFLESVQVISWKPLPEELALFEDTLGIDPGEAILYSVTATLKDFVLATGDKKSLGALSSSPDCFHVTQRLAGRVI